MKIAKRLFAVVIAVLMIAAMVVPFAADAIPTGNNTLTVNGKDGFTASVYKIADFNTTTGAFSTDKSDVLNALKAGDNAALLNAANALKDDELGSPAGSNAFTSTTSYDFSLPAGVYYVKWTTVPSNVTKAQNSVLVLPYYQNQNKTWVQTATVAGTKTSTGTISYDKIFTNAPSATSVNANIGDSIPFTITGSVPGSADSPAYALTFTDVMQYGLKLNNSVQIAVKGNGTALTVNTNYTETKPNARQFAISFDEDQLAYLYENQITEIQITYTATLTDDTVVIGSDGNPNTLTYSYQQSSDSDVVTEPAITKIVKTYDFQVKKVDANDANTVLENATFTLYRNTVADANLIDTKTTGTTGIITFSGLADGTYKVVETAAPANYALNSKVFTVTIAADGTVSGAEVSGKILTVPDPKVVLPNTGGTGTLLFTIGGIALIAGAAVLFVIYRKKSSSK
nr:SpaH/EbpB family LPXTG-anchored major pilin [uncultured Ruminococcus sp.]